MPLMLDNKDVEKVLDIRECMDALEHAFKDYAEGKAVNRPRSHTYTPIDKENFYLFKSMDGAVPRYGVHALRLTSEVIREYRAGETMRSEKIASLPHGKWLGLILLFSTNNGELLAMVKDGYLQRMRVGATSGLAAKYLSRGDSRVVGMFGSGWQAGAQLLALSAVRDLKLIKVYSPTRANLEKFVTDMKRQIPVEIRGESNPRSVVDGSDIIVAATNSFEPVFDGDWLEPGMHVNSVQGGELDARTLERADLVVIRAREPGTYWFPQGHEPKGANRESRFANVMMEDKTFELGALMVGKAPGRINDRQITFFGGGGTTGSNGLGIQFAAVAARIYELAKAKGLGREVPLDWFTQDVHP
jgi:ornithine cyclodeaminase/alanine dehydrogenase-like protein (mu-crystallin family)